MIPFRRAPRPGPAEPVIRSSPTAALKLPDDAPGNPEKWTKVVNAKCENSFTGTYFQVLPDDRDSYSDIYGAGSFTMTGLKFKIRVQDPGLHTLYVRWTGGETVGGGVEAREARGFVRAARGLSVPGLEQVRRPLSAATRGLGPVFDQFSTCAFSTS